MKVDPVKYSDLVLNGVDEFKNKINSRTFYITTVNNETKNNYMNHIIEDFIKSANESNDNHYLGIDLEFNKVSKSTRDVALIQINLEKDGIQINSEKDGIQINSEKDGIQINPEKDGIKYSKNQNRFYDDKNGYIFMFSPQKVLKDLNTIKALFSNNRIIKILHGSESLDIPYIFNQLLIDKDKIDNFCSNFYDTKFICDYYVNKGCSIYDWLLYMNIITQEKIDFLFKNEDIIGPLYLFQIDVMNLSYEMTRYALYDVIFLPELLRQIFKLNKNAKQECTIISDHLNLINKGKREIEHLYKKTEKLMNYMNNYYIYDQDHNPHVLNDIWAIYHSVIVTDESILKLFEINYFKAYFKMITKYIIYYAIIDNPDIIVYMNKNEKYDKSKLKIYNWLKQYKYCYDIFNNIASTVKNEIKTFRE